MVESCSRRGRRRTDAEGMNMGVNLTKGGNISLTKTAPGLTAVTLGLGWDARTTDGTSFDLDSSAIGVGADGRVVGN